MPRNPSPAQVEASKRNGRKSRGGKTTESPQRSAQNNRSHGLRATTLALEHEVDAGYGARSDQWYDWYQPKSPATMHLTNECARATLLADRSHNYRQSVITEQTTKVKTNWIRYRRQRVRELSKDLMVSPETTVPELRGFSFGIAFLRSSFQELIATLRSRGHLPPEDLQRAICLGGVTPKPASIRRDLVAYATYVNNLGCTPGVPAAEIADWLEPAHRPESIRDWPRDQVMGDDPDECRGMLIEALEDLIDQLLALEKQVREEVEEPALKSAMDRAAILTEADARRVARSHGDARAMYHKASKDLFPMLERERADELPESPDDDDDNDDADGDDGTEVVGADGADAAVPAEEMTTAADPAQGHGSNGVGDDGASTAAQVLPEPPSRPAERDGAGVAPEPRSGLPFDPEKTSGVSAQSAVTNTSSVAVGLSGSGVQNPPTSPVLDPPQGGDPGGLAGLEIHQPPAATHPPPVGA